MDITDKIKKTGLTENESLVYKTLLEIGPRPAGIISRKTGLHRRVIYDVTDRLIKKGLIGYIIENGKKIFSASNPERFMEILKEQEKEIDSVLPMMIDIYKKSKEKQREDTLFFKGKEGLKSVFEDQLSEKKEILIIGGSQLAYEILEYYFIWFDKKRVKNRIKTKIMFDFESRKNKRKIPLSEVRYLPEKYSSPLAINIYGEKVAIILWSKENPFAIVIKNKDISEGYKKYFELMWNIAKKV